MRRGPCNNAKPRTSGIAKVGKRSRLDDSFQMDKLRYVVYETTKQQTSEYWRTSDDKLNQANDERNDAAEICEKKITNCDSFVLMSRNVTADFGTEWQGRIRISKLLNIFFF